QRYFTTDFRCCQSLFHPGVPYAILAPMLFPGLTCLLLNNRNSVILGANLSRKSLSVKRSSTMKMNRFATRGALALGIAGGLLMIIGLCLFFSVFFTGMSVEAPSSPTLVPRGFSGS